MGRFFAFWVKVVFLVKIDLMQKAVIILFAVLLGVSGFAQTSETYQGQTINLRDAQGLRQGVWMIFDQAGNVTEKGDYKDNKKEGVWTGYYPGGKIKHQITYTDNRADGPATFYFENGKISEQGVWKVNKWVGDYKFYHQNGSLAYDWKYNESGKRTGEQKYYYADGSLMIKGSWDDGKKKGVLTEYYPDGSIKSELGFIDGKIDLNNIKEYSIAEKPANKVLAPKTQEVTTKEPLDFFTRTGYFKTFNEHKKIDREGDFVNGKLINGKRYIYDDDGNLVRTLIYKEGKITESIQNSEL
jgi:antitoxin component YwqK of YwqJK toxin-antitoxin module